MAMLGIIGGLVSAAGSVIGGISASEQADAQAKAMDIAANERIAVGQRNAAERARQAQNVISTQRAMAAASGGGATDPTVINLEAGVATEGDYQTKAALYEGNTEGANLRYQADLTRMQGQQAMLSGFIGGASSMINGFSAYNSYGGMPSAYAGSGSYYWG